MGDWFSDNGFTAANGYSVSSDGKGGGTATKSSGSSSSSSKSSGGGSSNLTAPSVRSSGGGGGGGSTGGGWTGSLRDAAKSLGATTNFDPNTGQVSVKGANGKSISFGNGQGSNYGLSGLNNGSNMVSDFDRFASALGYSPVRDTAASKGLSVGWNGANNSISLDDNANDIHNTLTGGFALGSNGKSYMNSDDLNSMMSDYGSIVDKMNQAKNPQLQQPQGLQAVAQQLMSALLAPAAPAALPSFAGQQQAIQAAYDAKLRALQGGLEDSKQGLEDKYFQNYLAARQAMANRGLAGSGLASDQDTRLLMAKQKDLAGIERDVARGKLDAADWLGGQNATLADKEFNAQQDALNKAQSAKAESLKTLSSFLTNMMPYDQAKVADIMKNELGGKKLDAQSQQFYDKLNMQDQHFYDGLSSKEKIANDLNGWRYYNTDTNADLGYTKNDTLNQHYQRSDANDSERNQIGWGTLGVAQANAETNRGDLNRKIDMDAARVKDMAKRADSTEAKFLLSQLTPQLTQAGQRVNKAIEVGDKDEIKVALAAYQEIANQINGVKMPNPVDNYTDNWAQSGNFTGSKKGVDGAYSSTINSAAKANGIYPSILKAVATQESSLGQTSSNVMQVNGMDNASPEESINRGAQMLGGYLQKYDLDWALAAYNMGEGIINYAKQNGISDPKQAMAAFSKYQKATNGYKVYGDPDYIDHVRRYIE